MQTTLRKTDFNCVPMQGAGTNEQTRVAAAKCAAPAPALVGLAYLIHQLNNPIQLVYGATGLLDQEMAKAKDREGPFLNQVLQTLKGGVDQLICQVSSLRSQMECLWLDDPSFESVNLSLLIDEILQGEAARFEAGKISLRKSLAANLPPILANEKLLDQALVNLFKNATEAMPDGGVLSIRAAAGESSVLLELADTGCGIPPGLDVFQPFATSKAGAMGLGLTIARHIVESNDGAITYRSEPGKGTTFCLSFRRRLE